MAAPISVLCVDDNPIVAELLESACRQAGIRWAGWRADATALLREVAVTAATVVVLDMDMPGPDPIEALAALAAQQPHIPVIVFSSHVQGRLVSEALDAGAWKYLGKDGGTEMLVRAIREVAGQRLNDRRSASR